MFHSVSAYRLACLSLLAVAACGAAEPAAQPSGRLVTSLAEIRGAWDIVRLGDYEPSRLHGGQRRAFVQVGDKGLSYTIECNYSGNPAHIDKSGVLHDDSEQAGSRMSTLMLCPPEEMKREGQLYGFFATKPTVHWAPGGRIELRSASTVLLLERPATRRLANAPKADELIGRWIPVSAMKTEPGGGYSGWGFGPDPGVVTIGPGSIAWSACPEGAVRYRYTADFRLERQGEAPPRCRLPSKYTGMSGEAPSRLGDLLAASPMAERTKPDGIALLTDDGETVHLRREVDVLAERREQEQPPPGWHRGRMVTPPEPPPPPQRPPAPGTQTSPPGIRDGV